MHGQLKLVVHVCVEPGAACFARVLVSSGAIEADPIGSLSTARKFGMLVPR